MLHAPDLRRGFLWAAPMAGGLRRATEIARVLRQRTSTPATGSARTVLGSGVHRHYCLSAFSPTSGPTFDVSGTTRLSGGAGTTRHTNTPGTPTGASTAGIGSTPAPGSAAA